MFEQEYNLLTTKINCLTQNEFSIKYDNFHLNT